MKMNSKIMKRKKKYKFKYQKIIKKKVISNLIKKLFFILYLSISYSYTFTFINPLTSPSAGPLHLNMDM